MTGPLTDAPARVLVVGEALVDVVPDASGQPRDHPGGSPANVAIALGRLDRDVRLVTLLGDDARGGAVRAWLEASGVTVLAGPTGTGRTSTAAVTLDASGAATYDFDLSWDLGPVPDEDCDVLHVGSIATVLEPGADAVLEAVRSQHGRAVVSLDPNARPAITPDRAGPVARVEELVALADVVKVSDEDLHWLHPDHDPVATATRWVGAGPGLVVVTRGSAGAVVVRRGGAVLEVPGVPVAVADTVGAGDTFSGVLLDALLDLGVRGPGGAAALQALPDRDVLGAVTTAAIGAAINVSRPGADPPWRAELTAALGGAGAGEG
ncbi:carbohydrate kinase [Nocardioides sp. zg-1308]|uniref:carbohydrate kinase family protein n=1 Tax=Nocardioides sp. zg-1308 TaxID=2736253 RepID=UPI0015537A0D|nr:carbohydrate kinase [Nocardioides sp. zg-1308]NPD05065.1 carbohydrate kinase [Nocardioides sp. zg-1308]